jgi:hypothetical protein
MKLNCIWLVILVNFVKATNIRVSGVHLLTDEIIISDSLRYSDWSSENSSEPGKNANI